MSIRIAFVGAGSVEFTKNPGPEAVIGEDKIDWAGVFEQCETKAGTEWYCVEHESSSKPIETVARMFEALKVRGKV